MAKYHLEENIIIYQMQNAIQNQFRRRIFQYGLGGSGKKTLKVVARYADGWNYGLCSYDQYVEKLSFLKNFAIIIK